MSKNSIIMFVAGVVIGSVSAWQILKKQYENRVQEEIESVKASLVAKREEIDHEKAVMAREKPSIEEYVSKIQENGYHDYSKKVESEKTIIEEKQEKEPADDSPCIIEPDEYGENEDYRRIELAYFNDGVLADNDGEVITDIAAVIGEGTLSQIGKYEDDALHVRNDRLKAYFEILVDQNNYEDVFNHNYYVED